MPCPTSTPRLGCPPADRRTVPRTGVRPRAATAGPLAARRSPPAAWLSPAPRTRPGQPGRIAAVASESPVESVLRRRANRTDRPEKKNKKLERKRKLFLVAQRQYWP